MVPVSPAPTWGPNGLHTKDDSDDVGTEEMVIPSLAMISINEIDKLDKDGHDQQFYGQHHNDQINELALL